MYIKNKKSKSRTPFPAAELRDDRIAAFVMSELLDYAERGTIEIIEKLPSIKLK